MTETIDYSEWLPRGVSIVNKFRADKKDLDGKIEHGRIARASATDTTIVGYLVNKGFVEPCQRDYGLDLMELRNALFGRLNAKTSAFMLSIGDCSLKRNQAETIYELVANEMKRAGERIIVHACTIDYEMDAAAKIIQGVGVYVNEFRKLEKIMETAITEMRRRKECAE